MNPDQMQESNPQEMSPEEAKAGLGLATRLNEQMLVAQAPQPEPQAETPQEKEVQPDDSKFTDLEGKMDDKMEILRTELKDTIKAEIGSIKDEIKNALANEQE